MSSEAKAIITIHDARPSAERYWTTRTGTTHSHRAGDFSVYHITRAAESQAR